MSKGSRKRGSQVSHETECANWMSIFEAGNKWELRDLAGIVLTTESTYEKARDAGLKYLPKGEDFSIVKV